MLLQGLSEGLRFSGLGLGVLECVILGSETCIELRVQGGGLGFSDQVSGFTSQQLDTYGARARVCAHMG